MTEIQNPKQKKQSKFKIRNLMILKKGKPIEEDIFINNEKIEFRSLVFGI